MNISQNGWSVIQESDTYDWHIPNTSRNLRLRKGPAGFVLIHLCLWFQERIEPIDLGQLDDWGYSLRRIAGTDVYSNHSSGTAVDINALRHPSGKKNTFTLAQRLLIKARLLVYRGGIRWGGTFSTTVDEMHWEIDQGSTAVYKLAKRLAKTPRGKRVMNVNKGGWVS